MSSAVADNNRVNRRTRLDHSHGLYFSHVHIEGVKRVVMQHNCTRSLFHGNRLESGAIGRRVNAAGKNTLNSAIN